MTRIKASRMKEIATRRRAELEEICREARIEVDSSTSLEKCYALIDSGKNLVDLALPSQQVCCSVSHYNLSFRTS